MTALQSVSRFASWRRARERAAVALLAFPNGSSPLCGDLSQRALYSCRKHGLAQIDLERSSRGSPVFVLTDDGRDLADRIKAARAA